MAKEICISSTPHETRLAILEDDQLSEIYYERENEYTLAGSIYNGRVTRVLPGMQSAFVDIGLERDAFLYVTDFMELEDEEETGELEKAAASGATQPPREVRAGRQEERGGRGRGESRQNRQEPRPEPRSEAEAVTEVEEYEAALPEAPQAEPADESGESAATGGRRWRGRRHRRGRRGQGEPQAESSAAAEQPSEAIEEVEELEIAPEIHAEAAPAERFAARAAAPEPHAAHTPFLLPGESLSKYGGTPAAETPKSAPEPASPVVTSRPSTLVEAPLEWDGSGLLPGETLSGRRARQSEPAEEEANAAPAVEAFLPELPEQFEEDEITEAMELAPAAEPAVELAEEAQAEPAAEPEFEEEHLELAASAEPVVEQTSDEAAAESTEPAEGSASHRIDPVPPTGFRLFGLGGKKKKEEPAPEPEASAPVLRASSYAPGSGLVEEEEIEGGEMDALPHRHKSADHDLEDYEEETLATQMRNGNLGELLEEAQLNHRIRLDAEGRGESEIYEVEEEGEEGTGEAAPATGRDRRGRGRRGRGAQGQQQGNRGRGPSRRSAQTSDLPIISDLLKPGQEILVQIAKEPIAKKGARITSHIALPGRFLVFMPTVTHVGVSRKIASDEERQRLKRILVNERGDAAGGFIVRTAAEGASEDELRADLRFLMNLWNEIKQRSESSKSPALIYHDLSLIERILRDQVSANFSNIWVDSEADYERIVRFLNRFSPNLVRRVKLYTKETPLFEHFGIQDEISKALRSKVWLKSGGSIVINQTEALVAIDINTGKYVGKSARLEDTILKTNLDAVPEIVRQIRLRDLGGIIVIDFIDMDERKNRFKVMAALEEALKSDRAPTKVLQFNDFGLVAITRKRVKQSLERTLSVPCPTCQATGMVKSPATVCNEIYVELRKMRRHFESADVLIRVNPETVKALKANNARWLSDFEELVGKNILIKSDATLHPEQFDIQG